MKESCSSASLYVICPNTVLGRGLRAKDVRSRMVGRASRPKQPGVLGEFEIDGPPPRVPMASQVFSQSKRNGAGINHTQLQSILREKQRVRHALPVDADSKAHAEGCRGTVPPPSSRPAPWSKSCRRKRLERFHRNSPCPRSADA